MTDKEDVDVDVDAHARLHSTIIKACVGYRLPVIGTVLATTLVDFAMISRMRKEQFTLMMSELWDITLKEQEQEEDSEVKH